jgi:hypothetical protein
MEVALSTDSARNAARCGGESGVWVGARSRAGRCALMRSSFVFIALVLRALAQDAPPPVAPASSLAAPSLDEKWDHFIAETVTPFTLGAGGFNATVSQVTRSAPLYGRHWRAYPKRFGASVGDIVSQNFFGDFLLASAFHEDTRYVREGPSHRLGPRVGYAISRAVVTRKDAGASTFNWANVLGTAMSAGLSNAYYPPISRTPRETLTNWSTSIAGSGMANLMPEFWPDVRQWIRRRFKLLH